MRRNGHKFNAQRTVVDGHTFASKAEATRYGQLKLLAKAGQISGLLLQPAFTLCVENGDYPANGRGRTIELGRYVADFSYYVSLADNQRQTVYEDVKGFDVPLQRWKRKHAEAQYGITVTIIRNGQARSESAKKGATKKAKR